MPADSIPVREAIEVRASKHPEFTANRTVAVVSVANAELHHVSADELGLRVLETMKKAQEAEDGTAHG